MTSTPRVGDLVHYTAHGTPIRDDGTQQFPSVCRAAIVTEVTRADDTHPIVSMTVFNPTGSHADKVTHGPGEETTTGRGARCTSGNQVYPPGTWHHPEPGLVEAPTGWTTIGHITGDNPTTPHPGEAFTAPLGTPDPCAASTPPTFAEATAEAAAVLRQARQNVGMESAQRLVDIADTWVNIAGRIVEHDEAHRL